MTCKRNACTDSGVWLIRNGRDIKKCTSTEGQMIMNMMDLLRIPGLDNLDKIREMRKESNKRMNNVIVRRRLISRPKSNPKANNSNK